jgi:hypothetical protein
MDVRMRLSHALAILTTPLLLVVLAGPADAEDLRYAVSTKKVVVNQSYENIGWRIAGSDSWLADYANVNLEHVGTRDLADFDYSDATPPSSNLRFYDFYPMGRYRVYGEVYDDDFNEMYAASAYVVIKAASRSTLAATRSGQQVLLRATAKKYTGSYPLWANHRSVDLAFQRLTSSGWRTVAWRRVQTNGVAKVTVRRAQRSAYRVVVPEAAAVWGVKSNVARR